MPPRQEVPWIPSRLREDSTCGGMTSSGSVRHGFPASKRAVCLDAGLAGNDPLEAHAVQEIRNEDVVPFRAEWERRHTGNRAGRRR